MNEIEQLDAILASSFWEDEMCYEYELMGGAPSGIEVHIVKEPGEYRWEVIWVNTSPDSSDRAFRTVSDAKNNLREFLKKKQAELVEAATPPARTDMC
jgi:hypothetical protein